MSISVHIQHIRFSPVAIAVNIAMLQDFLRLPSLQGLYWTLQIELIFYALCVGLFVAGLLERVRTIRTVASMMLAMALIMAICRNMTGHAFPIALPLGLYVMLTGLVWRMGLLGSDPVAPRIARQLIAALVMTFPVIAFFGYADQSTVTYGPLRYTVTYYIATMLFVMLTTRVKLKGPVLSYLGRISYSLYLLSALVETVVTTKLGPLLVGHYAVHVLFPIIVLAAVGLASLSYAFIEQPGIRLGKRVMAKIDGLRPSQEIVGPAL